MKKFIIRLIIFFVLVCGVWFFILVVTGNGVGTKNFIVKEGQGVNQIITTGRVNIKRPRGLLCAKPAWESCSK